MVPLQGSLGTLTQERFRSLSGVKCSLLNPPLKGSTNIPVPRAPGQGGRCGMSSGKLVTFRNKSSPRCQGRAFISEPAELGGAQLKGAGAQESGQGCSRRCCTAGQGEHSIVPVALLGQSQPRGSLSGYRSSAAMLCLFVSGLAAVPPSRANWLCSGLVTALLFAALLQGCTIPFSGCCGA